MTAQSNIAIETFSTHSQSEIAELVLTIQQDEFAISITLADQPELSAINTFFQQGNGNFWIALRAREIVGTVGLLDIGNQQVALRKMFVKKEVRGSEYKIASRLLQAVFEWCTQRAVKDIYLGTIDSYKAAHRFYEKNRFLQVNPDNLPASFPRMKVDNRFYHLAIRTEE